MILPEKHNYFTYDYKSGSKEYRRSYKGIVIAEWEDKLGKRWAINPIQIKLKNDSPVRKAYISFSTFEEAISYANKIQ